MTNNKDKSSDLDISEVGVQPSDSLGGENQKGAFNDYLTHWGHNINDKMNENEMKRSLYT